MTTMAQNRPMTDALRAQMMWEAQTAWHESESYDAVLGAAANARIEAGNCPSQAITRTDRVIAKQVTTRPCPYCTALALPPDQSCDSVRLPLN